MLEGKNYPTSCLVLPTMYQLIRKNAPDAALFQPWTVRPAQGERPAYNGILAAADMHPAVRTARSKLHDAQYSRWVTDLSAAAHRFYSIAMLCDPRSRQVKDGFFFVEGQKDEALALFKAEYNLEWAPVDQVREPDPVDDQAETETVAVTTLACLPMVNTSATSYGAFTDAFAYLNQGSPSPPSADSPQKKEEIKNEAVKWLSLPNVPPATDILEWWAAHEEEFPNLANMAAQFLSVPATSASAERLFSIAGLVFDDFRQNMNDGTLEQLLWAHINKFKRNRNGDKLS